MRKKLIWSLVIMLLLSLIVTACLPTGDGSVSYGNYIGNSNTKVFHKTSCSYVSKISSSHKRYFSSREAAINAGYRACQRCYP